MKNTINQQNRIRNILVTTATSPNKLLNNEKYISKCKRKSVIFRPQDYDLYVRLNSECPNASELIRDLLKKHFDKIDGKNNNN